MRALIPAQLSLEEWWLVDRLRQIPEGPLRKRVLTLLNAFLSSGGQPGCPEAQADGVPCPSADLACDLCGCSLAPPEPRGTPAPRV